MNSWLKAVVYFNRYRGYWNYTALGEHVCLSTNNMKGICLYIHTTLVYFVINLIYGH